MEQHGSAGNHPLLARDRNEQGAGLSRAQSSYAAVLLMLSRKGVGAPIGKQFNASN